MGMAWRPLRVRSRRSTSHGCSWLWTKNPPCQPPAGSVSASSSHGPSRRSSIQVCPGAYSIHPVVLTGMLVARAHHKTSQTPMLLPQPIGPTRTSRTGPRQLFAGRQDLRPGDRSRAVTAPPPAQQGNSSVLQSPHQEPTLLRGESLGDSPDATTRPPVRPCAQEEPSGGGPDADIDQDPREDRRELRPDRLDVRRADVLALALLPPPAEGRPLMDTAALVDCYAPDARVHPAGQPEAVDAGTWLAAFGLMLQSFPNLQVHPRNLAADDRVALLEARLTGTNTGPFTLGET